MRLYDLVAGCPVPIQVRGDGNVDIVGVVDDSRQVGAGDLFVARMGAHTHGACFLAEAIRRGAAAILTETPVPAAANGCASLYTEQPAAALGFLAHRIRGEPARQMSIFAVTGTNGKTTITYLVRSVMAAAGRHCGLIGTVQIDDGRQVVDSAMTTPGPVELARWLAAMCDHGVTAVALEASSHALAQNRLAGLNVHVAMFSNLTGDHLDYHGSMEAYAAAKARLFEALLPESFAVVNADDPYARRMVQASPARVVSYGLDQKADFSATIRQLDAAGMDLLLRGPHDEPRAMRSHLVGRHNALNILCAAAAARCAGVSWPHILAGVQNVTGVPGRLQPVAPAGVNPADLPFHVVVDYAHTHDALANVLRAIRPWTRGRIICLFGCGGDRDAAKRPQMAAVAEGLANVTIVTSDNPRSEDPDEIIRMICTGFSTSMGARLHVQPDRAKAIALAIKMAEPGDVVLLAGKGHEKYQIVRGVKRPFDDVEEARRALAQRYPPVATNTRKVR